MLRRIC